MHRKNNLFSICIITVIFFIGCSDDKTQLISNTPTDLPYQNYKINLQSNSGSFLETVTIYWNEIEGEVELMDSSTPITPNGNSHLFNLEPGEFKDISIQVKLDDSTYVDSIQIFTRPVYPVTNFKYNIVTVQTGNETKYHRNLTWSATEEPSENFLNYTIYRAESVNADVLINPTDCSCDIATLSLADTSYTDLTVQEESGLFAYFYQVQVTTGNGSRNSLIYNYTNFTSPLKIVLDTSNVSTNNNEFIQITWEPIINSNTLYQYEIWRSPDEELSDTTLLAIITNPEQGKFMDRNAGNGTSWYYSVAVVDINGKRKFSGFIAGWSKP